VATIIEALEELYPLQAEHKHLDFGSRWQQVVDRSVSRVRVQSDRMEQVRSDSIYEWSNGISTIGPIPRKLQPRILKSLAQAFTHRDNPYGNSNPNIAFQRDLDEAMEADDEYRTNPSLPRLCHLLAELAYKWDKFNSQSRRMSGSSPQILRRRLLRTIVTGITTKHNRSPYQIPTAWDAIDLVIHVRIVITRIIQASIIVDNGMDAGPIDNLSPEARLVTRSSSRVFAMIRMMVRGDDATMIDAIVMEAVGREGRGNVHFARDTGTPCLTSSITHLTCNCGGADVNSTYRQCLVSMRDSTT
jgi:hypothetical protein